MIIDMKTQNALLGAFLIVLALCLLFEIIFHPLYARAQTIQVSDPFAKAQPVLSEYAREEILRANATTTYMTADAYRAQFAPATTTSTTTIATLTAEIAWLEALLKSLSK